jgi:hypothetical protein
MDKVLILYIVFILAVVVSSVYDIIQSKKFYKRMNEDLNKLLEDLKEGTNENE